MKVCAYCGKENSDDAVACRECGTQEFKGSLAAETSPERTEASAPTPEEFPTVKLEFTQPTPKQMQMDLVTLLKCRTLVEADLIAAQLESAGIPAFIPDEFLMQNVRIQVAPKDFADAKELLSAPRHIS
jgi:hypothetical protein